MYMYTHVCIYIYMYTCMHARMHACTRRMLAFVRVHTYVDTYVCKYAAASVQNVRRKHARSRIYRTSAATILRCDESSSHLNAKVSKQPPPAAFLTDVGALEGIR